MVTRKALVEFLTAVEKACPYLKVRDLTIDYDEDKVRKASMIISCLVRAK